MPLDSRLSTPAKLILKDGTMFTGKSFGAHTSISGETVFNTGMVGYPETMTDPSYAGQILVCTYPLIGNYGVPSDVQDEYGLFRYFESHKIHITGLIVASYSHAYSHWSATRSLSAWMEEHNVPGIEGIDTRALTHYLRENGGTMGKIVMEGTHESDIPWNDPNVRNVVAEVSTDAVIHYGPSEGHPRKPKKVLLIDCGAKYNMIRDFLARGVEVIRVPWNYDFMSAGLEYDGIFISNGPGDPKACTETIRHIAAALKGNKPIFGICLGNQLLALAAGGDTYKLPYGHRGQNQPCTDMRTGRCYITSQNHGFAVDEAKMPRGWEVWFLNANDGTHEGMRHKSKPFMSVQFHPEATPGPTDTSWLFDEFISML